MIIDKSLEVGSWSGLSDNWLLEAVNWSKVFSNNLAGRLYRFWVDSLPCCQRDRDQRGRRIGPRSRFVNEGWGWEVTKVDNPWRLLVTSREDTSILLAPKFIMFSPELSSGLTTWEFVDITAGSMQRNSGSAKAFQPGMPVKLSIWLMKALGDTYQAHRTVFDQEYQNRWRMQLLYPYRAHPHPGEGIRAEEQFQKTTHLVRSQLVVKTGAVKLHLVPRETC